MKVTPRYLVQLSSAEIGFLHALVQRQVRSYVAEHPEGRGMALAAAPPELVSLDRRLLARLKEVTDDEEPYFARRLEAGWINEEHAALTEVAARDKRASPPPATATRQGSNVTWLHGNSRRRTRAG